MSTIKKKILVDTPLKKSFKVFVNELGNWWPKAYTWSKDELVALRVNPTTNGFFTEIGPYGFQCDWGRITKITADQLIFCWQINPDRSPEPNPDKASEVEISFNEENGCTTIILEHRYFDRHGEKGEAYRRSMDSPEGWDYILASFVEYLLTR